MRIRDIISEATLKTDVPNTDWLAGKQEYAQRRGRDRWGVPYMGATTGWFTGTVQVPVSVLKQLPGMRQEQQNVRKDDLAWLIDHMKKTGKLPLVGEPGSEHEYAPFVMVAHDGSAWVNEGNHRIMAAAALGWKTLPVEVKYFDGGERVKSGPMYPGKLNLSETLVSRQPVAQATVNEVADQPYTWTQTMRSGQVDKYRWQAADGAIYSAMVAKQYQGPLSGRTLEEIEVGFARTDPKTGKTSASITGTGDAFRVFATIRDIVMNYTNSKTPPRYIKFGGKSDEPSRIALYRRIAQTIQRWLPGYESSSQEQGDTHMGFLLQRQPDNKEKAT